MASSPLIKLFEKEMDRKEFFLYAGLILLTVTGISGVLKNVSSIVSDRSQKRFGSGPYGK